MTVISVLAVLTTTFSYSHLENWIKIGQLFISLRGYTRAPKDQDILLSKITFDKEIQPVTIRGLQILIASYKENKFNMGCGINELSICEYCDHL